MIRLVLAMLWARRGQALVLAGLAMLAVAASVAAPAWLVAAGQSIAAGQIATATTGELSLVVRGVRDEQDGPAGAADFTDLGGALLELPGFTYVYATETPTVGLEPSDQFPSRLVFRQDVCAHLRIVAGRCLIGEGDALIGAETATRRGLSPGDTVRLTAARPNPLDADLGYVPSAHPRTLTVSGTYRAIEPSGIWWGRHGYFVAGPETGSGEPVFTTPGTLDAMDRTIVVEEIDGAAAPGTIGPDHLDALRADLTRLDQVKGDLGGSVAVDTDLPRLLDRIEQGRQAARLLVPVLAVPLVLLACFSVHLSAGYGAEGRQSELAVVALRGSRWWARWWLATGESLVAVLAGALAGCLAGQLLTTVVTAFVLPGASGEADLSSLRYAPVAAVVALAAAVAAQRHLLVRPVALLLRRTGVPGRVPVSAGEAVTVLLAVITTGQLVVSGGSLTGLGLLAPAFVLIALALLAARALLPVVRRIAAWALRRGRLGIALAGLQVARSPGAARVFALLMTAAAVAGYAACAVGTAARDRDTVALLGTGADRVLTVQPVTRERLLAAVRETDPAGAYAMAVTPLAYNGLAVDAQRLAAVAAWPSGAPDPGTVAAALSAPQGESLPVAWSGTRPPGGAINGLRVTGVPVAEVAELPAIPAVGRRGVLVDITQAERFVTEKVQAQSPQVWLSAAAPPDVLDRLAAHGLAVVDDVRATTAHRRLDRQGAAVALRFHVLAGVLATLLGAGALVLTVAVDRRRRTGDLTALRVQGLSRAVAGQTAFWAYPALVTVAAVIGPAVALLGWALTGWALPLTGTTGADLPVPGRPPPGTVVVTGAAVGVVLAATALAVTRRGGFPNRPGPG
ncbi:hypothetical protein [Actinoplanes sp. NPDC051851]|uniref:hypothetical protein n=1 Tax=Actinoplanes sp. NPDC051851 TaxID=3154753 RepID=UPI0034407664